MQYLLLIYEDESRFAHGFDGAELSEYQEFGKRNKGDILGGNALERTTAGRTVRVRNGETVITDGPFAETKEQLGGYYLIEAESAEKAARIASEIPGARFGSIEVRPVMKFS